MDMLGRVWTYAENDADWQKKVCEKSSGQCAWPGCSSQWEAAGHHIFDRRHYMLRLIVENGVCLCGKHHQLIQTATKIIREKMSKLLIGTKTYLELKAKLQTTSLPQLIDPSNEKPLKKSKPLTSRDTGTFW